MSRSGRDGTGSAEEARSGVRWHSFGLVGGDDRSPAEPGRDPMTYAEGRVMLDADSHVMEFADFLDEFIDPAQTRPAAPHAHGGAAARARRRGRPGRRPALRSGQGGRGRGAAAGRQGLVGHGRLRPEERSRVLDLLGFDGQLVFATLRHRPVRRAETSTGSTPGHRRRTGRWPTSARPTLGCSPVAYVPLVDPDARASALAEEAIARRLRRRDGAVDRGRETDRPRHPDLDAFWSAPRGAPTSRSSCTSEEAADCSTRRSTTTTCR